MSPTGKLNRCLRLLPLVLCGVLVGSGTPAISQAEKPIEVVPSVSIENGDWTPLSVAEMERAAVDAALARLSDAGRLKMLTSVKGMNGTVSRGDLDIAIHLIGPAETVKVTMTLDAPNSPTLVSTAAISVRGLDYRGIYEAFEHVGERSADRLVAKLDHLAAQSTVEPSLEPEAKPSTSNDPARRKIYDDAQLEKRAGRYAAARMGFESLTASSEDPKDGLRLLAEDELRYGLPLFEAQQAMNQFSRVGASNQRVDRNATLARTENLYRQIEAENPNDIGRIAEAQRAIDGLLVMRRAFANAMRANVMSRATTIRMEISQFMMLEGQCPNASIIREIMPDRPGGLILDGEPVRTGSSVRYRVVESGSRIAVDLVCSPAGVEMLDASETARDVSSIR